MTPSRSLLFLVPTAVRWRCRAVGLCICRSVAENDPIQKALCGLMEHRVQQQLEVDEKDAREELEARNSVLLEAEKARKAAALALKRTQVGNLLI